MFVLFNLEDLYFVKICLERFAVTIALCRARCSSRFRKSIIWIMILSEGSSVLWLQENGFVALDSKNVRYFAG